VSDIVHLCKLVGSLCILLINYPEFDMIKSMPTLFRQDKKQPFMYSAIETRRSKPNYSGWVAGGILFTGLLLVAYLILT